MAETNLKQIAQSVIPDDPEASAYRFIIVAAKRARQLQNGARSFLPITVGFLDVVGRKLRAPFCNCRARLAATMMKR